MRKSSQSTLDVIFTNFTSKVMVRHSCILDHEAVEIVAPFLTKDKVLLRKQNLEL